MVPTPQGNLYAAYSSRFPADLSQPLLQTADGEVYSYAVALEASARLANALVQSGLQAGDRVTVQVEKSPQVLWLYLAVLRAGLVFHPLNTAYTRDEMSFFLDNAQPSMLVCDQRNQSTLQTLAQQCGAQLLTLNADGGGSLMEAAARCEPRFETVERNEQDTAALLYSSGTTGRPKGIMLSHGNLRDNAETLVEQWGFCAQDVLLHALPVFHVHGLFVAIGCVLLSGASMRWLPRFDAQLVLGQLPDCTVLMGVPTYYTRLLAEPSFPGASCDGMRLFISGSAPLLAETFMEFQQRTGQAILERYGMSETGMNTSNPLHGERRVGTVGPALPGVSLRIVDHQDVPVPVGAVGDIQVRGANVFTGYWKMPEKTAEEFTADGFFRTGDKGQMDSDGYVSIVGRARDMVISGGLNVYPKEVELLIDELPGVLESAVIGLPHPDLGEAVAAVVVLRPGSTCSEDQLVAGLRGRLAGFKLPRTVVFADQLPRNTMGKVQKNLLRQQFG
jgi:malonyl-CoA/methylmalonyl-CoA synthetase